MILRHLLLLLLLAVNSLGDKGCLFEFEDANELADFDLNCDGLKGNWEIVDIPASLNPPDWTGDKALITPKKEEVGCMVTLGSTATLTMGLYYQDSSNYVEIRIDLKAKYPRLCVDQQCSWNIANELEGSSQVWHNLRRTIETGGPGEYQLQIKVYRGFGADTPYIDNVGIEDILSDSDQCYVVPRTTTTTESTTTEASTTESTTTEASTTESTTTEASTTESTTTEASTTESTTTEASTTESTKTEATTTESTTTEPTTKGTTATTTTTEASTTSVTSVPSGATSLPGDETGYQFYWYMVFIVLGSSVLVFTACLFCTWQRRWRTRGSRSGRRGSQSPPLTDQEAYDDVRRQWGGDNMEQY